jgi:hypothetical protein
MRFPTRPVLLLCILACSGSAPASDLTQEERRIIENIEKICVTRASCDPVFEISLYNPTDEALTYVKDLSRLHTLTILHGPRVTDRGMQHLKGLRKLEWLTLNSTRISDRGLRELKDLAALRYLSLFNTPVTDRGLEEVQRIRQLRHLNLARTAITDKGLESIANLVDLRVLILAHTGVTDKGLEHLTKLDDLELLILNGTKVSSPAICRLKEAIPGLDVMGR